MKQWLKMAVLLLLAFGAHATEAQTCSAAVSTLNFGTYTGTVLNGTASGTVTCAGAWTMALNAGTGVGATETARKMTGPAGKTLNYQLFTDSARTNNWGNTTGNELTGTGNTNITVYGQMAAGQSPTPGTYTDTVTSATASFTITVVVPASCTISATALAFGNYTTLLVNATSTISVSCTSTTPYNVGLNAGTATGATVISRKMIGPGAATLAYSLFSNSARTTNWGNTVGTDTLAGTGSGAVQGLTVYGQIPAGQRPTPGNYTDTIIATLTY